MLTLVVCLTLVALSGAVVLRMTLDDGFQRATRSPQQRRALSSSAAEPPPLTGGRSPEPVPAATAPEPSSSFAPHAVEGRRPVADDGRNARRRRARWRRLRSGTLLVALLLAVGGVLALVVAVTLGLLVAALRAAVG